MPISKNPPLTKMTLNFLSKSKVFIIALFLLLDSQLIANDKVPIYSENEAIKIKLTQVNRRGSSPVRLSWGPAAKTVPIKLKKDSSLVGFDHLGGEFIFNNQKYPFIISKSKIDESYDTLYLDSNASGELDEQKIIGERSHEPGRTNTMFFTPKVQLRESKDQFQFLLSLIVDSKDHTPTFVRMWPDDASVGEVKLGGEKFYIIIREMVFDGVYDQKDAWELRSTSPDKNRSWADVDPTTGPRKLSAHAWAGNKAYKIKLSDNRANSALLIPFKPKETRQEEKIKTDRFYQDRIAERAKKPLVFDKDVMNAISQAKENNRPFFLKFETSWCGPCVIMDKLVFPSKSVTDSSKGVICIAIDGDKYKKLVEENNVRAYPTGILFDQNGKEIKRYVGYRGVKPMTDFFENITSKKP